MASISQTPAQAPAQAPAAAPVFWLRRLRSAASSALVVFGNLGLFTGIALLGGIGSSWYMIEVGTPLTTVKAGPWTSWPAAATPAADPYTRARAARHGSLPISGTVAQVWEARIDGSGQRLRSSCDYAVTGRALNAGWWTIAIYDDYGHLIPNAAGRYSFNSSTIMRSADGSFLVTLARDARPGNWLPTGAAGRLRLVLTLIEAGDVSSTVASAALPSIRKVACR